MVPDIKSGNTRELQGLRCSDAAFVLMVQGQSRSIRAARVILARLIKREGLRRCACKRKAENKTVKAELCDRR